MTSIKTKKNPIITYKGSLCEITHINLAHNKIIPLMELCTFTMNLQEFVDPKKGMKPGNVIYIKEKVPLYKFDPITKSLFIPGNLGREAATLLEGEYVDDSKITINKEYGINALSNCKNKYGEAMKPSPVQLKIIDNITQFNKSHIINAAMGGGKTAIVLWMLSAIKERPLVVAGKSLKDTQQLIVAIQTLIENNPDMQTEDNYIMVQGSGKTIRKKDKKILEKGKGIILMTHKSFHHIPKTCKFAIIDECHAAASKLAITRFFANADSLKRVYALSATTNMRADGGEKLLNSMIGPELIKIKHIEFEQENRVVPMRIYLHRFTGKDPYAHVDYNPQVMPSYGHSYTNQYIQNHRGRNKYVADVLLSLPINEAKIAFTPTIKHAQKIIKPYMDKLNKIKEEGLLTEEEYQKRVIYLFHAEGVYYGNTNLGSSAKEGLEKRLLSGDIKMAISTNYLAVGVDSNKIDTIIELSGELSQAMNTQKSGRSVRFRENKLAKLHLICDTHTKNLSNKSKKKMKSLLDYYSLLGTNIGQDDSNQRGVTLVLDNDEIHYEKFKVSNEFDYNEDLDLIEPNGIIHQYNI